MFKYQKLHQGAIFQGRCAIKIGWALYSVKDLPISVVTIRKKKDFPISVP